MDGDLDGDLAAFTANLAAFDAAAARACLTLDRVAEAAGHVELGCAPVLALTSQLLLSHRNVESVHACLADIERFTTVADRVQHALNALTTAEDIASRETVVVAQHDDLDALVDVMLEAERFLEANDYLPDVKDAQIKLTADSLSFTCVLPTAACHFAAAICCY